MRSADGLNHGRVGAQVALFVGVQDGHEADLGQVEALPQKVDAHDDVVDTQAQIAEDLHPVQGLDI